MTRIGIPTEQKFTGPTGQIGAAACVPHGAERDGNDGDHMVTIQYLYGRSSRIDESYVK